MYSLLSLRTVYSIVVIALYIDLNTLKSFIQLLT